ncbi:hypothetical protein FLK61_23115 [Paenalkalicoccus suaedae]|uniref:Uncharacterized protein n=1 Tax=Paenalkalicoccus suaedae TaxID=2592382 RepID=A0A859FAZ0_9BACI|nr:hypothetical protein [Paenalkalicoccus suaedae]QKS69694.1 hypothetical protein FLK61_23115 [Paenalkalicoccus suaedae]
MTIYDYFTRTIRTYIRVGSFITLLLIGVSLSLFIVEDKLDTLLALIPLAIMGPGLLLGALYKRSQQREIPTITQEEPLTPFAEHRRLIAVPVVHWLREVIYFTPKGQSILYAKETATGVKRAGKLLLHLIGLRPFLKQELIVYVEEEPRYFLKKDWGVRERFHIYKGEDKLGMVELDLWKVTKANAKIYCADGTFLGENDGGFSGQYVRIKDSQGDQVIELKRDGIPIEAISLFGNLRGDIVNVINPKQSEKERELFLLAPLFVELHFGRN